ncbi:hypothetical protein ES319_D05G072200v1 [Gossypium barbadense]|uniref:DUF7806 domain-containing protein n=4 Tax=Gossypium TaxID=3633 RepID=A0A5J5RCR6_GOSBA|nr:hypothetical protein ES319_D05G072200v1 [Gossypium barbadense]TYG67443.1 hypothetical protein ES288_D05G076600v1 [Gossypium darwinii]TYH69824.1 hypothetical protein ES332_D05G078100v1 [Gossypium tomentosum]
MEPLYAKLYDKYDKLKKRKLSEMDDINRDQEEKFVNYVRAAEELIQHLKSENDKLYAEVNELKSEVASKMSSMDKQCADYQKLLIEENQKYKALSLEVSRLQNLHHEGQNKDGKLDIIPTVSARIAQVSSEKVSGRSIGMMTKDLSEKALSREDLTHFQLPECCKGSPDASATVTARATCLFQALTECLLDMKISTNNQTGGLCISALHQPSGYSFSLTWINKAGGEEAELVYRVLSLGTFERVVPEWMRDVIKFSTGMCPLFFQRVAHVIKLHC